MSSAVILPPVAPGVDGSSSGPDRAPSAVDFRYTQTASFVTLLEQLGASLLVSTYQANKLLAVRATGGGLSTLVRSFERPMGIAADARRLALGTRDQIWLLRNAPDIAPRIEPAGMHDACYVPRSSHVTGDIGIHEIAWAKSPLLPAALCPTEKSLPIPSGEPCSITTSLPLPSGESAVVRGTSGSEQSCVGQSLRTSRVVDESEELWLVSTRFSCLCTLDPDYSFVPRWRPPFITALAAEDRCHLNGLALQDGRPKYVTALGETDTRDGWRPAKPQGGCLIDVPSGQVLARGLSMPHSPRWHDGQLWLLESGTGQLVLMDLATGRRQTVAQLPGFTRGLAFCGPYAFVGLSKIRPSSAMDGVPLAERRSELKCGVATVDLRSGQVVAVLEFQTAVEEIFDVQLLPGLQFPEIMGFQKETIHHTFIIPA